MAEVFGKQHKHVLEAIKNLFTKAEFSAFVDNQEVMSYFAEIEVEQPMPVGGGVKKVPAYIMTCEGFDLLVMGFTGEKALAYKVAYIKAFMAMSRKLREMPEKETRLTSFIPPVSDGNNAIAQTIANLNAIKEDYARHVLCLEKYGYGDTGKFIDDFSDSFLNFSCKKSIKESLSAISLSIKKYDVYNL